MTYRVNKISRKLQHSSTSPWQGVITAQHPKTKASPTQSNPPRHNNQAGGGTSEWTRQQKSVCVYSYLKFALQGGSGAIPAVLVHHHHHVGQRVHPHLLHLQVLLQELPHTNTLINTAQQENAKTRVNDGGLMTRRGWKYDELHTVGFRKDHRCLEHGHVSDIFS